MKTIVKMRFVLIIIPFMLLQVSCNQHGATREISYNAEEVIKCLNCDVKDLQFEEADMLFQDMEIVKLETSNSCLIGTIEQIEVIDNDIFIFDNHKNIFRFSKKDGTFLNKIGFEGQGPGEYIGIRGFSINKKLNVISVVCISKMAIITYDFQGNHISSQKVPAEVFGDISYAVYTQDGSMFINNHMYLEPFVAYISFNPDNKKTQDIFTYEFFGQRDYMMSFSTHPIAEFEDGLHFIMPVEHVVYEYKRGNIRAQYEIEIPWKLVDREQVAKNENPLFVGATLVAMNTNTFSGFNAIFQTKNKMLLNFTDPQAKQSFILIDKETKEGTYYHYSTHPYGKNPFFKVLSCTEEYFISELHPNMMNMMYSWMFSSEKIKDVKNKVLQDALNQMSVEDNPYLIFYKQ